MKSPAKEAICCLHIREIDFGMCARKGKFA